MLVECLNTVATTQTIQNHENKKYSTDSDRDGLDHRIECSGSNFGSQPAGDSIHPAEISPGDSRTGDTERHSTAARAGIASARVAEHRPDFAGPTVAAHASGATADYHRQTYA